MSGLDKKDIVLVVDDTPENIDVLLGVLGTEYIVKASRNGEKALKIARGEDPPDIILLDIMMPEMDGYQVCKRLKEDDATKDIPVIFITAKTAEEDEIKGFEIGGVDYITKPISPPVVLARVRAHLALMREKQLLQENLRLREDVEQITSHDLKSPLTAIIGSPELIKYEPLTEDQLMLVNLIEASGYKMLNMINLSLDLYKMEKGIYEVMPESLDLLAVIKEIVTENKSVIKHQRLSIDILMNGTPVSDADTFILCGEKLLLYSMLSNLIKNAIEASSKDNRIIIQLSRKENFIIRIHNQGVVPLEIRDTFFEKYATAGKSGGTGLGTYSAKLIAEIHEGKIFLESSEENGTEITVTLPGV